MHAGLFQSANLGKKSERKSDMRAEISMESIFNHFGDLLALIEREVGVHLNSDIEE